jgi:hypothetical protein
MTEQESTLQLRTSALTTLALTRHPELQVRRSALADSTHKEVFFKGDRVSAPPRFVAYFHGEVSIAGEKAAGRVAQRVWPDLAEEPSTVPLLLAVFSHTDDRGWITWVTKPVDGELVAQAAPDCRPFDRTTLDDIVSTVKAWRPAVTAGKRT